MSVNDLGTVGHSLGFAPTLDNTKSMKYNSTYVSGNTLSGNGLTNNRPFAGVSDNQTSFVSLQNSAVGNACGQYKCSKNYDTTNSANGIVGVAGGGTSIVSSANLAAEFRPYYEVKDSKYMVWYDFTDIKLSHLI
jgi:hypothetical protein